MTVGECTAVQCKRLTNSVEVESFHETPLFDLGIAKAVARLSTFLSTKFLRWRRKYKTRWGFNAGVDGVEESDERFGPVNAARDEWRRIRQ
jgi:hypothetical protein